jgi:hypothetical protein
MLPAEREMTLILRTIRTALTPDLLIATTAIPSPTLRVLDRSPDALRDIQFILRPRAIDYIRPCAIDSSLLGPVTVHPLGFC